jgi:hypothetical protein
MATKQKKALPKFKVTPAFWELMTRLDLLEVPILRNGLKGSELVKAFALARALRREALEIEENCRAAWSAGIQAMKAWNKLSEGERKHLLNGWHCPTEWPSVEEYFRTLAGYDDNELLWMLRLSEGDGEVNLFPSFEIAPDIADVSLLIRQGVTKAEALRQIDDMREALEAKWEEAVASTGRNLITHPIAQGRAEDAEKMLSPGTFVMDTATNEAGIILGGYQGTNGILYTYLNAKGEVDSQYGGGFKVATERAGGLPVVSDLNGRDPLAALRVRNVNKHAGSVA